MNVKDAPAFATVPESERKYIPWARGLTSGFYDIIGKYLDGSYTVSQLKCGALIGSCWIIGEPCGLRQICDHTGLAKSTASRAVIRYMEDGLVVDIGRPDDRRRSDFKPSALGVELLIEWTKDMVELRQAHKDVPLE